METISLPRQHDVQQLSADGFERVRTRVFFKISAKGPPLTVEQVGMLWGAKELLEEHNVKLAFKFETHPLATRVVEPLVHGYSHQFGPALSMFAERQLWEVLCWGFALGAGVIDIMQLPRPCSAPSARQWFWKAFQANVHELKAFAHKTPAQLENLLMHGWSVRAGVSGIDICYPGYALHEVSAIAKVLGAANLIHLMECAVKRPDAFDGMPDVAVVLYSKRALMFVECKTTDALKPNQIAWIEELTKMGIETRVLQVKSS